MHARSNKTLKHAVESRPVRNMQSMCLPSSPQELAQHPAIRAVLDYKWKRYARWLYTYVKLIQITQLSCSSVDSLSISKIDTCSCCSVFLMLYAVRMLFLGLALLIAARPGLDNPGCYRDGWDLFRGICEGMAILLIVGPLLSLIMGLFWYVAASGICSIYSCMPYVGVLA